MYLEWFREVLLEVGPGGGGGRLGSKFAWMCVSKSEGHGSFFRFKGVK